LNFLLIISCVFRFSGCDAIKTEKMRLRSPDSRFEAVMIETDGNATVSVTFNLYIVPVGNAVKDEDRVLFAKSFSGYKIRWVNSKFLEIEYKTGRIYHFQNIWRLIKKDEFPYEIELRLVPLNKSESFSILQ